MNLCELEDQNKFKKHLGEYWASKGITQIKIPQIGGQELNMFKLYRTVCKKGGGQSVSHNKLWKEIVDQFGLPSTCTSASFTLKNHYQKYLLGYEQRFFFGKDDNADLPELVAGRQRRPLRNEGDYNPIQMQNRYHVVRPQHEQIQSTLSNDLRKYYDKCEMSQPVNYIKRTKLYPAMPEVKHMIMAFQLSCPSELIYAINTLTLFSINTETPFLLAQYPYVLDSLQTYFLNHYPPRNLFGLQCLRSITLAIRNLLINPKNLQSVLNSEVMDTLLSIFYSRIDREVTRNLSDILSSLTHAGFDCKELFEVVELFLERDLYEDLETGIDLLRSLVEQKEELCEDLICCKMPLFTRLLLYSSLEVREAILEMVSYLSEKSDKVKQKVMQNVKFVERLCAMMSHAHGSTEKQAQLACNIVKNIALIGTPRSREVLKQFQRPLMLASFNNEFISPVITEILFQLSGRTTERPDIRPPSESEDIQEQ